METKGRTVFLSVIGIATLLVAIIGATFAFFTTQMTGTNANVSATAAKVGAVSFTAQGVTTSNTKILPGWTSGAKTVTVTYGASDVSVAYTCTLNVTANTFSDMKLTVSGDNVVAAANNKTLASGASNTTIASGTIPAGAASQTKTMSYTLTFPETNEDQNTQQNANLTASVTCALSGGTIYYNNTNQTGTTTKPGA